MVTSTIIAFILSIVFVPWIMILLPSDYFAHPKIPSKIFSTLFINFIELFQKILTKYMFAQAPSP